MQKAKYKCKFYIRNAVKSVPWSFNIFDKIYENDFDIIEYDDFSEYNAVRKCFTRLNQKQWANDSRVSSLSESTLSLLEVKVQPDYKKNLARELNDSGIIEFFHNPTLQWINPTKLTEIKDWNVYFKPHRFNKKYCEKMVWLGVGIEALKTVGICALLLFLGWVSAQLGW